MTIALETTTMTAIATAPQAQAQRATQLIVNLHRLLRKCDREIERRLAVDDDGNAVSPAGADGDPNADADATDLDGNGTPTAMPMSRAQWQHVRPWR